MNIKHTLFTCIILFISKILVSQTVTFNSQTVDEDFVGPAGIFIEDINNDGHGDIICAGMDANTISWWQNNGNQPISWTKHEVDTDFGGAIYVQAGDIDDDGNMDIVAAAWDDNEISWWKNDGGNNIQWTKYTIKESFLNAHEVNIHDIDLDGDLDIIGVSAGSNSILWFENDGNFPISWIEHEIVSDFAGARSVDALDIDNDGDIDLCGAALDDNEISWWRNDGGSPIIWTKNTITSDFVQSHKVQLTDLDQDGDIDILGTAYSSGISWWRNDGGNPIIWERQSISGNSTMVIAWAVDLDLDNDMDIISTAQGSGYIAYFINTGQNSLDFDFTYLENFPGAWPLHYGDIDNDNDIDMVCGGNSSDEIRWYQNDIVTKMNNTIVQSDEKIQINWVQDLNHNNAFLEIFTPYQSNAEITIYDISGKKTIKLNNQYLTEGKNTIDLTNHIVELEAGIYVCSVTMDGTTKSIKLILPSSNK